MSQNNPTVIETRCVKCGKLLAKNGNGTSFEIKCNRCGTLNAVLERSSEQIIITDPEGTVLYTNEAFEVVTGYSIKEVIGAKPSLWGGNMSQEFYAHLWHTIKHEKQSIRVVVHNKRKDGTMYDAWLQISPILDSNREILFFVGIESPIINNITDEKT